MLRGYPSTAPRNRLTKLGPQQASGQDTCENRHPLSEGIVQPTNDAHQDCQERPDQHNVAAKDFDLVLHVTLS